MSAPKFVRFQGDIVNLTQIIDVCYNPEKQRTAICYGVGSGLWAYYDGDCRDAIWELIKLAMKSKDELYPSDTTHLEQRIKGIEEKIGDTFTIKNREPIDERTVIGYTHIGDPVYSSL